MLENDELPTELRELEHQLQQPPQPQLSSELQNRVLYAVQAELSRQSTSLQKQRRFQQVLIAVSLITAACLLVAFGPQLRNKSMPSAADISSGSVSNVSQPGVSTAPTDRPFDDEDQSVDSFPSIQQYRLALHKSTAAWEQLMDQSGSTLSAPDDSMAFLWSKNSRLLFANSKEENAK